MFIFLLKKRRKNCTKIYYNIYRKLKKGCNCMKTFVIGYLDFFDNDLKLEKVEAENAVSASSKSASAPL